jgi:Ca2+-binding EF-hand superfamily protein
MIQVRYNSLGALYRPIPLFIKRSIKMNTRMTAFIGIGLFIVLMLGTIPMVAAGPRENAGLATDGLGRQAKETKRSFVKADIDGDGSISLREFYASVNGRLDNNTVKRIFNASDKDQNGKLSMREFSFAVKLILKAKANGIGRYPDYDKDGNVSLREFYRYVNGRLDNDTVKRIFRMADKDQNGQLSRREFVQAVNFMIKMKANRGNASPDKDGDKMVSQREFYAFINGRLDDKAVKRIFNASDKDQNGQLSMREFAYAVKLARNAYNGIDNGRTGDPSGTGDQDRERSKDKDPSNDRTDKRQSNGRK